MKHKTSGKIWGNPSGDLFFRVITADREWRKRRYCFLSVAVVVVVFMIHDRAARVSFCQSTRPETSSESWGKKSETLERIRLSTIFGSHETMKRWQYQPAIFKGKRRQRYAKVCTDWSLFSCQHAMHSFIIELTRAHNFPFCKRRPANNNRIVFHFSQKRMTTVDDVVFVHLSYGRVVECWPPLWFRVCGQANDVNLIGRRASRFPPAHFQLKTINAGHLLASTWLSRLASD